MDVQPQREQVAVAISDVWLGSGLGTTFSIIDYTLRLLVPPDASVYLVDMISVIRLGLLLVVWTISTVNKGSLGIASIWRVSFMANCPPEKQYKAHYLA